jgi:hypothetical protein
LTSASTSCPFCLGHHAPGLTRREQVTDEAIRADVFRIGTDAYYGPANRRAQDGPDAQGFGPRFAYDVGLLLPKLPGPVLLVPRKPGDHGDPRRRARCIGWMCNDCLAERTTPEAARRAEAGFDFGCPKCCSEFGLSRVYESSYTRSDLIRALFPLREHRRAAEAKT